MSPADSGDGDQRPLAASSLRVNLRHALAEKMINQNQVRNRVIYSSFLLAVFSTNLCRN